ncbi:MAG: hypothetical protein E3K37_14960 [Candidatus Kuenenia sp.]|nr:hypothetical protein [Candidatus Kuenenia hertensis]
MEYFDFNIDEAKAEVCLAEIETIGRLMSLAGGYPAFVIKGVEVGIIGGRLAKAAMELRKFLEGE